MLLQVISDGASEAFDDPELICQPWANQLSLSNTSSKKPLRVGIIRTDGHVQPLPPVARLMGDVAQTLSRSNTAPLEVTDVTPKASPILARILKVFNGIMSIDGGNAWFDLLDKTQEPLSPWLQNRLTRRPMKSLEQVRALQEQKTALQTAFLKIWKDVDVLVFPVAPHPIPPIDRWNTANYTGALNLLDVSAGVLPVRNFTKQDLQGELEADKKPMNGWDKINMELWTKVDRNDYLDSPLSVQVVTPRLTERKLCEAMELVDQALKPLCTEGHSTAKL